MPEQTGLHNRATSPDLYVYTLLRFDVVENSICIVSFLLVL